MTGYSTADNLISTTDYADPANFIVQFDICANITKPVDPTCNVTAPAYMVCSILKKLIILDSKREQHGIMGATLTLSEQQNSKI